MALISKIEELRPHLPVAYANGLKSLPAFDAAIEQHLTPIIGAPLLGEIVAGIDAGNLNADYKALLNKCRSVIAPFAYADNLPFMQTLLSDNGLIVLEAEQSRKAFKWEYNIALAALIKRGFAAQEALITHLRNNLAAFPSWQASPYNDATSFGLIRNGEDLRSVVGLQQPQRCYAMVKPLFRQIADLYLKPAMGENFYEVFIARVHSEQYSGEDLILLKKLRGAAARWVMAAAATELNISFGDGGFTVTDSARLKDSADEGRLQANMMQVQSFIDTMQGTAMAYMQQAMKYLNETASAAVFPEFFVSELYEDPNAQRAVGRSNDQRAGIFIFG
jgi:hypothetical protein